MQERRNGAASPALKYMPNEQSIEKIDDSSFYVVTNFRGVNIKSSLTVADYKASVQNDQAAITADGLAALVQATTTAHQNSIATASVILHAAADAGIADAVQAIADLGI